MPYVISTLTAAHIYIDWDPIAAKREGAMPLPRRSVTIAGGTNIPTKALVTPTGGVVTQISDAEAEWLPQSRVFRGHEKNGFVKILKNDAEKDAAFEGMQPKDASAPLTAEDFAPPGGEGQQAPTFVPQTGKPEIAVPLSSVSTPESPTQDRVDSMLRATGESAPGVAGRISPAPSSDAPASQAETELAAAMATGEDSASLSDVTVNNGAGAPPTGIAGTEPTPSQNSEGGPAEPSSDDASVDGVEEILNTESSLNLVPDAGNGGDTEEPRRRARRGVDPATE